MFIAPGLVLGASILLFTFATSPVWRGTALLLTRLALGAHLSKKAFDAVETRLYSDAQGNLTYFRSGPMPTLR